MVYKAFAVDKVLLCSASVRHNAAKYYLEGRGMESLPRLFGQKLQLFFPPLRRKGFLSSKSSLALEEKVDCPS